MDSIFLLNFHHLKKVYTIKRIFFSTYVKTFSVFISQFYLIKIKIMENNKEPQLINPAALFNPSPYGFSHSISVDSPFRICFISGQSGGVGENHVLAEDFKTQVQDALKNLKIVLQSHSMTIENIVKISLLIVDYNQEKLEIWAEEAKKVWKGPFLPTSTLIPVSQLALPGMLFEIDAIAVKS